MGELDGKVAIVTGGANGIGRATVELFVAEGAGVVIADLDEDAGTALADGLGDAAAFVRTDVGDRDSIEAAVDRAVQRFGGLHVMYNNAGVSGVPRRFLKDTLADFDQVIGVSLLGVMLGSQAAARRMVEQGTGGAIVNTASLAGITPGAGVMSYRVAKAGVIHFTRCLALEVAEHGIRANVVAPANIATAINAGFDMGRTIEVTQPLASHGTPEDAAQAALYLASDRARQVTGTVLPVDGGTSVGIPVQRMAEIMRPRTPPTDP
ncbi:SDR family NAD(P)-dependent oxidoreductase [Dermatobacter hominis]|uniref:SDR family NAD(P)-dependent oxidoreductase n=1 Tax=Dermatobacter hominis TaxID=2884263 RepID=UPI001D101F83|nr:SDR family oxidoreductase [Dermatobacter hominis]UDY36718.1 SDR family oxidoreductase [Dermatobacter hominis]